jgi:hypothetical protein
LLFTGVIRFGQDGNASTEDLSNEASEYAEADSDGGPRTVMLRFRRPDIKPAQFAGASAFASFANVGLTTDDTFGAAVDNCAVFSAEPVEDGQQLDRDIWLFSDIKLERATDDTCQLNRMAYQAAVIAALA